MRSALVAVGMVWLVVAIGCSKNERLPYGLGVVDRVDVGGVRAIEITPPVGEATYERDQVTTGKSPLLMVGEADGYRAAFVIRFTALPESSVVDRAVL
jgi:hypothetical protein